MVHARIMSPWFPGMVSAGRAVRGKQQSTVKSRFVSIHLAATTDAVSQFDERIISPSTQNPNPPHINQGAPSHAQSP
jgi:hypothetical protein